jgi:hypothetical protein
VPQNNFLLFSLFASSRESASSALMRVELRWRPFWAATLLTGDRWLHSIKQVERFRLALLLDYAIDSRNLVL